MDDTTATPNERERKRLADEYVAMMAKREGVLGELLGGIKKWMPELEEQARRAENHWGLEDLIYRFYHQSFKVYRLQAWTTETVKVFEQILPNVPLNKWFLQIVGEGTGKVFDMSHNARWLQETRPIVEAATHTDYFLAMMIKYGKKLDEPPQVMPSGWASVLYLYNLR